MTSASGGIPGAPCNVMVIGYGNPLRRDDGIGPRVAAAVAQRALAGVRSVAAFQLLPELAAELAGAERVLFVDARAGGGDDPLHLVRVRAAAGPGPLCHFSDPGELLALAWALYGAAPEAWLLTVPAADLGFGEGLSDAARVCLDAALACVERWATTEAGRGVRFRPER